jgi:hypothetical protein
MKAPLLLLAMLPPLLAVSAVAQQKKPRVMLPPEILGVWGSDAEGCKGSAIEEENRLEVEQDGLLLYVTGYSVKTWHKTRQPSGDVYSARAIRGEEGEEKPSPGRYRISLKRLPDGKLQSRVEREAVRTWVKCPAGTTIR